MLFRCSYVILLIIRIGSGPVLNEGAVWVLPSPNSCNRQRPLLVKTKELRRWSLDAGICDCLSA